MDKDFKRIVDLALAEAIRRGHVIQLESGRYVLTEKGKEYAKANPPPPTVGDL